MFRRRERATLDDVVELLAGLGRMLMELGAKLDDIIELLERLEDPDPEDRDRYRRRREQSEAARQQMQEIMDRLEARMAERRAAQERGFLRRLFAR